jgi:IclR family transcriptional regulator, acetate operon repressor
MSRDDDAGLERPSAARAVPTAPRSAPSPSFRHRDDTVAAIRMQSPEAEDSPAAERQGIQVIARAAAVLRALERRPDGLSLGELAKVVSLPRSTVQRLVDALDNEGFVLAASSSSGVRLGPTLLALAAATRFHIAEAARETLEGLAKECGETVDLSLIDQDKVVFIDQVSGTHRLTAISAVGVSFPLHSSANGKAVLAAMPDDAIAKLKRRLRLTPATANTITTWERLEREIEIVREKGYACDREENSIGISAVSVAIRSPAGELAAISIPAPTHRFVESMEDLTRALVKHAGRLQQKLNR